MGDMAEGYKILRERTKFIRAQLAECCKCRKKNYPEFEVCGNCGEPNENYGKELKEPKGWK